MRKKRKIISNKQLKTQSYFFNLVKIKEEKQNILFDWPKCVSIIYNFA